MATTDNGWPASRSLPLKPLVVGGASFVPGITADDDVHTVLEYVATQFHERVEPLVKGWCWGFAYRENRNANALSRHSGGIAIDCNAPNHPNGVPTRNTFTPAQIAEVHKILAELDGVVRWGGDYTGTPDAMHFEINADRAAVARVADHIRGENMPLSKDDLDAIDARVTAALTEFFNKPMVDVGGGRRWSLITTIRSTFNKAKS